MTRWLPAIAALALALPAAAHEGEDHSAPGAAPAAAAPEHPRAGTATDLFELVVVADDTRLILYLDRFESNEPVTGARIEVASGALETVAGEVEPGVYQVLTGEFVRPGVHAVTVDVRAGDDSDLLAVTLAGTAAPERVATSDPVASAWQWPIAWGALGATLVVGAGLATWWRNGRDRKHGKDAAT